MPFVRKRQNEPPQECVTLEYTTITGCSVANTVTTSTSTATATATETAIADVDFDVTCSPANGCGLDSCPVNLAKRGDGLSSLHHRGILFARGNFRNGDWPDPADRRYGNDRAEFMRDQAKKSRTRDKSITPNEEVIVEDGMATTTNYVLFEDKPTGLLVQGLYGCVSVIFVSKRGAWASHIWETHFKFIDKDGVPDESAYEEYVERDLHIGKGTPGNKRGYRQLAFVADGEERETTMFGGPAKLENGKRGPDKEDDMIVHAYIVVARARPGGDVKLKNGRYDPPEEVRMDPNHPLWPKEPNESMSKRIPMLERDIKMFEMMGQPVKVETILYVPVMPTDKALDKRAMIEAEAAPHWKELGRLAAQLERLPPGPERERIKQRRDEKARIIEEIEKRKYEVKLKQQGDRDRKNHRGKVLIQYQPGKRVPEEKDCDGKVIVPRKVTRKEASWRIFFEDAEVGHHTQSWEPYDYQWFDELPEPYPEEEESEDESDEDSSSEDSDDDVFEHSDEEALSRRRRLRMRRKRQEACSIRTSSASGVSSGTTLNRDGSISATLLPSNGAHPNSSHSGASLSATVFPNSSSMSVTFSDGTSFSGTLFPSNSASVNSSFITSFTSALSSSQSTESSSFPTWSPWPFCSTTPQCENEWPRREECQEWETPSCVDYKCVCKHKSIPFCSKNEQCETDWPNWKDCAMYETPACMEDTHKCGCKRKGMPACATTKECESQWSNSCFRNFFQPFCENYRCICKEHSRPRCDTTSDCSNSWPGRHKCNLEWQDPICENNKCFCKPKPLPTCGTTKQCETDWDGASSCNGWEQPFCEDYQCKCKHRGFPYCRLDKECEGLQGCAADEVPVCKGDKCECKHVCQNCLVRGEVPDFVGIGQM